MGFLDWMGVEGHHCGTQDLSLGVQPLQSFQTQGRNRASRGLRPGRDQKPTVAGPKDMWMALRAKPRLIDVEFPARQHHEDLKSGTTNIKK